MDRRDPDVTVVKVYAPQDGQIQVHQNRVAHCPSELPAGFFWYGTRRASPGRPPKWIDRLLRGDLCTTQKRSEDSDHPTPSDEELANSADAPPENSAPLISSPDSETPDVPRCLDTDTGHVNEPEETSAIADDADQDIIKPCGASGDESICPDASTRGVTPEGPQNPSQEDGDTTVRKLYAFTADLWSTQEEITPDQIDVHNLEEELLRGRG